MVVGTLWHSCEAMDVVHHVLWVFPIARVVWKRMLRTLYPMYDKQVYNWGFVRWARLVEEIHNYEKEYIDFLLLSNGRHVMEASYTTPIHCLENDEVWVLRKARCTCVFQKVKPNAVELVKEIWLMLLHTLRDLYEAIPAEPDVCFVSNNIFEKFGKRQRSSPFLRRE